MNFKGKTALITGAAVGIGRAVALLLGEMGADLILLDIDYEGLCEVKEELASSTGNVQIYSCDISDDSAVNEVIAKATKDSERVDILVNNAAIWKTWKLFADESMEAWRRFFDINVHGTACVTKAVLPMMLKNSYGRIINVASVAGVYGNAHMVSYSATKGAIIAFTKALAKEVADKGILVNCVSPGSVSPSGKRDIDYYEETELSFIGRTGTDRENANLICFLASDESSYISAQNIQIDGCRKKQ